MEEDDSFLMVAAIDFGTTFSGYASSFKGNPEIITMNKNWGGGLNFASYKTHTSVLTKDTGEFVGFGFEAETRYADELEDDDDDDDDDDDEDDKNPDMNLRLYRHFKMILHSSGTLSRHTQIESVDKQGKASALDIVAHALRYLKNHLLEAIQKAVVGPPDASMIRWVVTVPAIWSEESKQFMREAAFKAGCINKKDSRKLIIALEPEAASLCCRRMDIAKYPDGTNLTIEAGTKYLVIDNGGGTVDITAHQVLGDGNIRELHSASGGAWGGTRVDANFVDLLRTVLGDKFIDEYQKRCPQQWLVFMTSFEKLKKSVSLDAKKTLNIPLTYSMKVQYSKIMGSDIQQVLKSSRGSGVKYNSGNIMISHDAAKALFEPVVKQIIQHVESLLTQPDLQPCKLFFLVGGFSESSILQDMIKAAFQPRVQILIPSEAQMAVIKGAVLFGHKPTEIKSRKARFTYGCKVMQVLDSPLATLLYDQSKVVMVEGSLFCAGVYCPFVAQGDEIEEGHTTKHTFGTISEDQDVARVVLYSMNRRPGHVDYVDSLGVKQVGEFIIDTPGRGVSRPVNIEMTFGGTEIQVKGYASGKPTTTTIDFMTK